MSSEEYDYEDEEIAPRPRTPKSPVVVENDVEGEVALPPSPKLNDDDPEDWDHSTLAPIRAGWTAGQNVMDSSSGFAQILKLDNNMQIIKFLEDQPYANYRRHWVDRRGPNGISKRAYTCLETVSKTCPLCSTGDRPQAVSSFNVALIGDDGQVGLKTWDVGSKLFATIRAYANDPKVGPLSKAYFAVNRTGKAQTTQYNLIPVRENALEEDYDVRPPSVAEIRAAGLYDSSIIQIPKKSDLEEIAQEISDGD